jgi:3-methylcrotonyl-CoA carboxylase alpha subunit
VRAGELDTGLIERDLPRLTEAMPPRPETLAAAVLAAEGPMAGPLTGFHLWSPLARRVELRWQGEPFPATLLILSPEEAEVTLDGRTLRARRRGPGWCVEGCHVLDAFAEPGRVTVFGGTEGTFAFEVPDPLEREVAGGGVDAAVSPMPGLVRAVLVAVGQEVAKGDRLVVVEAMKMEHAVAAPHGGRVAEVLVAEGEQVEAGAPLVRLEGGDG